VAGGGVSVPGVFSKFLNNSVEIMGGKFSYKLEIFLPWVLLKINFLKDNRHYPHTGWENLFAEIFSKLLLGQ
jgi:hypothetical protein